MSREQVVVRARADRIAVVVDDLDAVVRDLRFVFDVDFVILHVDAMVVRVAISECGIELVEKTVDEPIAVEDVWRMPVASLEVRVDDIDAAVGAMVQAGHSVHHSLVTPGGVPKVQMGTSLLGLPLLLYSVPDGTSYVAGVTGNNCADDYEGYAPAVDWPGNGKREERHDIDQSSAHDGESRQ